MDTIDYRFVFSKTQERQSDVILHSPKAAPICLSVGIDHFPFHSLTHSELPPVILDILDLAAAIHVADKLALPQKTRPIRIHIDLPLHNPEIFAQFNQQLSELMFWYTSDHWSFQFSYHEKQLSHSFPPIAGYAKFSPIPELTEIALWSGGLDSLAGLYLRLMDDQNKQFVLIGTGSNGIMHGRQKQVFHSLRTMPIASGRLSFLQLPIDLDYKKKRYRTNKSHRARGIVFLLIGAVTALLIENHRLSVYETGIGAINLPLPGGIGRDHSKAVHPISLVMVGNLISNLLGRSFSIENPFILRLKVKCASLLKTILYLYLKPSPVIVYTEKSIANVVTVPRVSCAAKH